MATRKSSLPNLNGKTLLIGAGVIGLLWWIQRQQAQASLPADQQTSLGYDIGHALGFNAVNTPLNLVGGIFSGVGQAGVQAVHDVNAAVGVNSDQCQSAIDTGDVGAALIHCDQAHFSVSDLASNWWNRL